MQNQRFAGLWIALGAFALVASICGTANAEDRAAAVWPTKQWQTSTPEQQGMDSTALARLEYIPRRHSRGLRNRSYSASY